MQKTKEHRLERRQEHGNESAVNLLQRRTLLTALGGQELLRSFSAVPATALTSTPSLAFTNLALECEPTLLQLSTLSLPTHLPKEKERKRF